MYVKIVFIICFTVVFSFAQELITLKTRDDIKQRVLINEATSESKAIAILFSGGKGKLKLHKDEDEWALKNFLIRSRNLFNEHGITTLSVDAPSKLKEGMQNGFRTSDEHKEDISYVIQYIQKNYPNIPIWIIGTSRGTVSATFNALNQENIHGLVLTSSLLENSNGTTGVIEMDLEKLTIPTLVIAHEYDGCYVTPPSGAQKIYDKLSHVLQKEVKIFSGGYESGKPCKSQSYHGFLGIEKEVVLFISDWVKKY